MYRPPIFSEGRGRDLYTGYLMFNLNTSKPQFFLQNTSCTRKPQVISRRGGGALPCTLPLDPPLGKFVISVYTDKAFKYPPQKSFKFGGSETPFPAFVMRYVSEKFDLETENGKQLQVTIIKITES